MTIPDPSHPPEDASDASGDSRDASGGGAEPFGSRAPDTFGADVRYDGEVDGHHYLLEVRHRLLDTTARITIDGVAHDPKEPLEKKAARRDDAGDVTTSDGVAIRLDEGLTGLKCVVRRSTEDRRDGGSRGDRGQDGGFRRRRARPTSRHRPSPQRCAAHTRAAITVGPSRGTPRPSTRSGFALLAAVGAAAKVLVPLLGIGALVSGLLSPILRWVYRLVSPLLGWLDDVTRPVREWIGGVVGPVLAWLGDLLRPVFAAWDHLMAFLFGWIPDLSLPFSVPDWVFDIAKPVALVVIAFVATYGGIRRRRQTLAQREQGAGTVDGAEEGAQRDPVDGAEEPTDGGEEPTDGGEDPGRGVR
jgi:hypothetical protein